MTIRRQALGRIAKLGEYYDCRSDTCCGQNLYLDDLPPDAVEMVDHEKTNCEYVYQDSIKEKFNKLGIEGELKVLVNYFLKDKGILVVF